jgi:hypothetical protein
MPDVTGHDPKNSGQARAVVRGPRRPQMVYARGRCRGGHRRHAFRGLALSQAEQRKDKEA